MHHPLLTLTRLGFTAGLAAALLAAAPAAEPAAHGSAAPAAPAALLARLAAGNERFVLGTPVHADQSGEHRRLVAQGQHPFAIILTCADSRVPPELIFDEGLGSLFVIRNAGNLLDDHVLASMEYAVEHLQATLIVVLGHSQCGAVKAAVAGGELPGHLPSILASLQPALTMAVKKPGDPVENGVRINARLSAAAVTAAPPILAEAVRTGTLQVVAARYDIVSGRVEFLE